MIMTCRYGVALKWALEITHTFIAGEMTFGKEQRIMLIVRKSFWNQKLKRINSQKIGDDFKIKICILTNNLIARVKTSYSAFSKTTRFISETLSKLKKKTVKSISWKQLQKLQIKKKSMFQNLYAGYETYNINHLGILAQKIYQKSNKIINNKNSLFFRYWEFRCKQEWKKNPQKDIFHLHPFCPFVI